MLFHRLGELLGLLDRGRADEHRLELRVGGLDLANDRAQFFFRRAIDFIVLVVPLDRLVGRNLDDIELIDFGEFIRLGRRRSGHPGEFAVETEIILEGDRGERHVLRLDRDMLLGFERLMQPFRVAAARHHPAGELVNNDDFALAHDVILVALEQFMRAQGLVDVMHDGDIGRLVERTFGEHPEFSQQLPPYAHCRRRSDWSCVASRRARNLPR